MVFIYVIQLQEGKYYIGKTDNPQFRLEIHFSSSGSVWTKKYKPIKVLELVSNCDNFDEDKYTMKYMEKYGINNVRGGSFCEVKLSDSNRTTLEQIMKGVTDKCYICGKNDHFANDCKKKSVKKEQIPMINVNEKCDCHTSYFSSHRRGKCMLNNIITYFEDEDEDIDKLLHANIIQKEKKKEVDGCFRCGREGHYEYSCYAKTTTTGVILEDEDEDEDEDEVYCCSYCHKEFDTLRGATCHQNLYCNKNKKQSNDEIVCRKCGREGHYSNGCYASRHIKGYSLK